MADCERVLVFLPENVRTRRDIFLSGSFVIRNNCVSFYGLPCEINNPNKLIYFCKQNNYNPIENDFITILCDGEHFNVSSLILQGENIDLNRNNLGVVLIFYDVESFCTADEDITVTTPKDDHFVTLRKLLRSSRNDTTHYNYRIIFWVLNILCILSKYMEKTMAVLKFSFVAVQIQSFIDQCIWCLKEIIKRKGLSLKVLNFVSSVIIDLIMGYVTLMFLSRATSIEEFPDLFLLAAEEVVTSLRDLLQWLAGTPAGFKLNHAFNDILGKFFLFHTNIWWYFLAFISPALGHLFYIFTILGKFGLSMQAAIVSDLLALVSFHIYCIYAYAARLYNIQVAGIVSLWRLFLGRKRNPLRDKVDSCQYTADQLFIGTLLFTVLLFLLPTTLLYYFVFTSSRLVIVTVGGILTKIRIHLHALPIYSSMLWLIGSSKINSIVRILENKLHHEEGLVVTTVCGVPGTFMSTNSLTLPDCIEFPKSLPRGISGILGQIMRGDLLYPV